MELEYKVKGNETIFKECPFCGNLRWNFQVNFDLGVFNCWVCGNKGRTSKLKYVFPSLIGLNLGVHVEERSAVSDYVPIMSIEGCDNRITDEVKDYFFSRNFNWNDIFNWNVKVRNGKSIVFPLKNNDGKLIYYVEKNIQTNKWGHPKGISRKEVVWVRFCNQDKEIVLVEGIFDAMRTYSAGLNVMLLLGSMTFPKDVEFIKNRKLNPVLFLDGDVWQTPREKNKYIRIKKMFGEMEYMRIRDKTKDPSDFTKEEIMDLFKKRKWFGLEDEMKLKFG